jgi:hypothetical protein
MFENVIFVTFGFEASSFFELNRKAEDATIR